TELIATEPRDRVGRADAACERAGDRLQDRVTGGVTVPVVDGLEAVEIGIQQCATGPVAIDIGEGAFEFARKAAPVEHVGERVCVGARLKLLDPGLLQYER